MSVKVLYTAAAICAVIAIAGCSSDNTGKQTSAQGPKLIPYTEKQKRDAGESSSYAGDWVQGAPTTANVDGELSANQDRVWNDGQPFDGLRVVLDGNAFSVGLLGPPKHCHVEVRSKNNLDQVESTAGAEFKQTGANEFIAIVPTVHCTDSIAFGWNAPAVKAGAADYKVSIAPVDGSCSPVHFGHLCVVDAALRLKPMGTVSPN